MIIILFCSLLTAIYLVRYFEQKRTDRLARTHEKRKEDFQKLLSLIKEEKTTDNES